MTHLYLLDANLAHTSPPAAWQGGLLLQQQAILSSYSSLKRQREYLTSRLFLNYILKTYYPDLELSNYIDTAFGPVISGIKLSLSHSHQAIAIAVSQGAVGVDIEQRRPRTNLNELAELFMTPSELDSFELEESDHKLDRFYHLWTAKEALYKSLSLEQQQALSLQALSVTYPEAYQRHLWIENCFDQGYCVALSASDTEPCSRLTFDIKATDSACSFSLKG